MISNLEQKIPCRQICGACHRVSPIDFAVPKEIWLEAVNPFYRNDHICIYCFAAWADDKLLPWDNEIEMYATSLHTLLAETSERVSWEAIARELLFMLSEYDTGANPLPRLIEKHTETKTATPKDSR